MPKYTVAFIKALEENSSSIHTATTIKLFTSEGDALSFYHSQISDAYKNHLPFMFIQIIDDRGNQLCCNYVSPIDFS